MRIITKTSYRTPGPIERKLSEILEGIMIALNYFFYFLPVGLVALCIVTNFY